MKHLFFAFIAVSTLLFNPVKSNADWNYAVYSACWFEVNGEHYIRIVTNKPSAGGSWDSHIYVNLPGSGWTGQIPKFNIYTDPNNSNNDIVIYKLQDHGYSLPTPLNDDDCFLVFPHPNSNPVTPYSPSALNACKCEEADCDAGFEVRIGTGPSLAATIIPYSQNPNNNYIVDFGDGNVYTGLVSHLYSSAGTYTVCLTVDNGTSVCRECLEICVNRSSGSGGSGGDGDEGDYPRSKPGKQTSSTLYKYGNEVQLTLYPVPADNLLKADYIATTENRATIVITDINGKQVLSIDKAVHAGKNHFEIDTQALPAGMYIMKLSNGNSTTIEKFSISK